ncbi:FmdB family zinc ribbon protein [Cellulomonas sp. McL0617]|uniref:FmdB family zinc ribbon protein n=1 Tax=Cellulomonas sp. McL0617 TaxID=3415675 RepID=UPI003CE6FC23
MPTYAYACTVCGHAFEAVQSFSDESLTVCPECDGRLRKVFSSVGVVFKGSGFYRNDARAGAKSSTLSPVPSTSSADSSSSSSSSSSSESSSSSPSSGSSSSTTSTPAPAAAKPAASS